MIRDLAEQAMVLPIHCLATFGNACHIIGMICTLCRSQKLYWDRMLHSPSGKKLAEANKNAEWVQKALKRIHQWLEENPNDTVEGVTEGTFINRQTTRVKRTTHSRYYVAPEIRKWKAMQRRAAFKVVYCLHAGRCLPACR
jgi:hypothetical protein